MVNVFDVVGGAEVTWMAREQAEERLCTSAAGLVALQKRIEGVRFAEGEFSKEI